jgi:hypothetical protein
MTLPCRGAGCFPWQRALTMMHVLQLLRVRTGRRTIRMTRVLLCVFVTSGLVMWAITRPAIVEVGTTDRNLAARMIIPSRGSQVMSVFSDFYRAHYGWIDLSVRTGTSGEFTTVLRRLQLHDVSESWLEPVGIVWSAHGEHCAFILRQVALGQGYYIKTVSIQSKRLSVREDRDLTWLRQELATRVTSPELSDRKVLNDLLATSEYWRVL